MTADELTPHEEHSLLRIADGETRNTMSKRRTCLACNRSHSLSSAACLGLTLMGVRKVAQLKRI